MRAGVISSAAISKYGRMDAAFYLGNPKEDIEKIKRARTDLKRARARLLRVRQEAHLNRDKHRSMVAAGEVQMIQPTKNQEGP